VRILKRQ